MDLIGPGPAALEIYASYDCLFTVLHSLQCCGGRHGILLVQLPKQLDEVCYNHTPGMHTSIVTSQIIFAYNNSLT